MYNRHCLIKCPLELQANVLYKHTVLYEYMASCHKYISKASLSFTMSKSQPEIIFKFAQPNPVYKSQFQAGELVIVLVVLINEFWMDLEQTSIFLFLDFSGSVHIVHDLSYVVLPEGTGWMPRETTFFLVLNTLQDIKLKIHFAEAAAL